MQIPAAIQSLPNLCHIQRQINPSKWKVLRNPSACLSSHHNSPSRQENYFQRLRKKNIFRETLTSSSSQTDVLETIWGFEVSEETYFCSFKLTKNDKCYDIAVMSVEFRYFNIVNVINGIFQATLIILVNLIENQRREVTTLCVNHVFAKSSFDTQHILSVSLKWLRLISGNLICRWRCKCCVEIIIIICWKRYRTVHIHQCYKLYLCKHNSYHINTCIIVKIQYFYSKQLIVLTSLPYKGAVTISTSSEKG